MGNGVRSQISPEFTPKTAPGARPQQLPAWLRTSCRPAGFLKCPTGTRHTGACEPSVEGKGEMALGGRTQNCPGRAATPEHKHREPGFSKLTKVLKIQTFPTFPICMLTGDTAPPRGQGFGQWGTRGHRGRLRPASPGGLPSSRGEGRAPSPRRLRLSAPEQACVWQEMAGGTAAGPRRRCSGWTEGKRSCGRACC